MTDGNRDGIIESMMTKGMGVGDSTGCKGESPTPITNNGLNKSSSLHGENAGMELAGGTPNGTK